MKDVTVLLRDARKRAGFTQMELASALDVHETLVSQWETGRKTPPADTIPFLTEMLNLTKGEVAQLKSASKSPVRARPSDIVQRFDGLDAKLDEVLRRLDGGS